MSSTTTSNIHVCDSCGSPTIWLPIDGYEDKYEVSNKGYVRNVNSGRVLTTRLRRGYKALDLHNEQGERKTHYVHALVCAAFHGPRPAGHQVCHYPDATKTNNHADNLEWGTPSRNIQDWVEAGCPRPKKPTKLKAADVIEIRRLYYAEKLSGEKIANQFGIKQSHCLNIIKGLVWTNV